jgi:4-hydroxybenzoate polyprenyltransferase
VASVGEATLWKIAIGGYMSCFLGQIAVAIFVSPFVAILMFVGGVAAPLYNWGLRLKRRPGFAEIAIGWAVFFGYLWGWAWNQPITRVSPIIWVLAYFFAITALIKDLPDVRGDEQVKASGIFSIRRQWVRKALLLFIYMSPYIFVITLVIVGILPVRFLALCLLVILGLTLLVVGEKADTTDTMIVAYELAFLYVHLFFLLLFILDTPTNQAIIVATVLFVARIFSVYLGLAPRFVEADFSWTHSTKILLKKTLKSTILS